MLRYVDRTTEYVFQKGLLRHFRNGFRKHRVKLAFECGDDKILKCSFKTFRSYYGNHASIKYRDPWEVKYRMGHRSMSTTELYINRAKCRENEYAHKICRTTDEECDAITEGYEYVKDTNEGSSLWRKTI